jgi:hypothetical protein
MNYYCHNTPGRLRIKTPIVKHNPVEIKKVGNILDSVSGINSFSINDLTGSIIIKYNPSTVDSKSILNVLGEKGYFHPDKVEENNLFSDETISKAGWVIGKALVGACVEMAFEGSVLAYLSVIL